ncbi:phage tail protein [Bordetella genomosp. 9]|uniref:Phage tail protein n=1 Tax=Bordetella genomosp. 9 TaxID=1416803 RepID=A0A261REJ1_9BORD|nr:tail protein X [Bordetella genomosp. 9]OZI23030.1 phage tail protein [Bordetella genomosp. 9]
MKVRTQQHDTVDALCWRNLHQTRDVVEQTLELNPGLADLGPVLPHGLLVELPQVATAPAPQPTTKLWD